MKTPSVWCATLVGVGVVLIAASAAALFNRPWLDGHRSDEVVLDAPLDVADIATWRGRFDTPHSGAYDLVVAVSGVQNEGGKVADCLLGGAHSTSRDCSQTASVIDLEWRLQRGAVEAAPEDANTRNFGRSVGPALGMSSSVDLIERHLAVFPASEGESFTLAVSSKVDWAPLRRFNPRIRVRPSTLLVEELYLRAASWELGAELVAVYGALLVIVAIASCYRGRAA